MFNDPLLSGDQLDRQLERYGGRRRLFFVPGPGRTALAAGGLTVWDHWALLWGGETHPEFRGRGLYRAVVAARLRALLNHTQASFAAVYADVRTSARILTRFGFRPIGRAEVWKPAEGQSHGA